MNNDIVGKFEYEQKLILIGDILPSKLLTSRIKKGKKYSQIKSSIVSIGLVEPLVVYNEKSGTKKYMLLDGHIRLEILRDLGENHAVCMMSKDDEAFTYNKRICRLSPVQEHNMILKAIKKNVPEEKITAALGLSKSSLKQRKSLLNDICPEVIEILKKRHFPLGTIRVLKKLKPLRQMYVAEIMVSANNFPVPYAQSLLMVSSDDQLRSSIKKSFNKGVSEDERQKMENEMENLSRDVKMIESDYAKDLLNLQVINGFMSKLLSNKQISRYLEKNHQDMHGVLNNIMISLNYESEIDSF